MLDFNWVNLIIWFLALIVIMCLFRYLITSIVIFRLTLVGIFVVTFLWFLRDRDYAPLVAMLVALSSLQAVSMVNKRERVSDNESKTQDNRQSPIESSNADLEITVWKAHKQEYWMKGESLEQWVLIFIITNHGRESIFFERLQIIFVFCESLPSMPERVIHDALNIDRWLRCGLYFDEPEPDFRMKGLKNKIQIEHDWLHTPHDIKLFNWETGKPIHITPFNTYRSPDPGGKEVWCLHGKFPQEMAKQLLKSGLHLNAIETIFHTDKGRNTVVGSFTLIEAMPEELKNKLQ